MKAITRIFGAASFFITLALVGGCGGGGGSSTVTQTTPVATSDVRDGTTAGTIQTNRAVTAVAPVQSGVTTPVVALTMLVDSVITPPAGVTLSAATPPAINVSIPADNADAAAGGLPRIGATGNQQSFTVARSNGAVDIALTGMPSFTLSQPATVKIPVNAVLTNPVNVYSVKTNGTTRVLQGTYSVENGNKIVTVTTTDFCYFIVNPVAVSGSQGGN